MPTYTIRQLMQTPPSEFPTFVLGESRSDSESMEQWKLRVLAQAFNSGLTLDSELECSVVRPDPARMFELRSITVAELRSMPSDRFPRVLDWVDVSQTMEGRSMHRGQTLQLLERFSEHAYVLCVVEKGEHRG